MIINNVLVASDLDTIKRDITNTSVQLGEGAVVLRFKNPSELTSLLLDIYEPSNSNAEVVENGDNYIVVRSTRLKGNALADFLKKDLAGFASSVEEASVETAASGKQYALTSVDADTLKCVKKLGKSFKVDDTTIRIKIAKKSLPNGYRGIVLSYPDTLGDVKKAKSKVLRTFNKLCKKAMEEASIESSSPYVSGWKLRMLKEGNNATIVIDGVKADVLPILKRIGFKIVNSNAGKLAIKAINKGNNLTLHLSGAVSPDKVNLWRTRALAALKSVILSNLDKVEKTKEAEFAKMRSFEDVVRGKFETAVAEVAADDHSFNMIVEDADINKIKATKGKLELGIGTFTFKRPIRFNDQDTGESGYNVKVVPDEAVIKNMSLDKKKGLDYVKQIFRIEKIIYKMLKMNYPEELDETASVETAAYALKDVHANYYHNQAVAQTTLSESVLKKIRSAGASGKSAVAGKFTIVFPTSKSASTVRGVSSAKINLDDPDAETKFKKDFIAALKQVLSRLKDITKTTVRTQNMSTKTPSAPATKVPLNTSTKPRTQNMRSTPTGGKKPTALQIVKAVNNGQAVTTLGVNDREALDIVIKYAQMLRNKK